jgi:hypothetical protein
MQVWTHAPHSAVLHPNELRLAELRWSGWEPDGLRCYAAPLSGRCWSGLPPDVPLLSHRLPEHGFPQDDFPRDSRPERLALPSVTSLERGRFLPQREQRQHRVR